MCRTLLHYQHSHVYRLGSILKEHSYAIDTSPTGSGKSITALHTFKQLGVLCEFIVILCPPTLCAQWERYLIEEEVLGQVVSINSLLNQGKRRQLLSLLKTNKTMIVNDESHLFKNGNTQRYGYLSLLLQYARYMLCLSATPLDSQEQIYALLRLLRFNGDIETFIDTCTSCMQFSYTFQVHISLYHFTTMENHEIDFYKRGCRYIKHVRRLIEEEDSWQACFQKGISYIHDSLFNSLLKLIKHELSTSNRKIVVVLFFKRHFDQLMKEFPDTLLLDGSVKMNQRSAIIEKFQQPNMSYRMLITSASVGGAGIELDDKHGSYPRHMIVLPTTNGIDFIQMIGRIMRYNTRSDSIVSIVQPDRNDTYFSHQMKLKMPIIEKFSRVPTFIHKIDKHYVDCCYEQQRVNLRQKVTKDLVNMIGHFACSCKTRYV